jgi:hypothetical protein
MLTFPQLEEMCFNSLLKSYLKLKMMLSAWIVLVSYFFGLFNTDNSALSLFIQLGACYLMFEISDEPTNTSNH